MAAAVEFFDVKTAAGVLHLAARRRPYSENKRFAVRYSSLSEKERLKALAKNIFTAEGERLASARTLSHAPLAVVKSLESAFFRLTIAGDDGREVDDFSVAAAEVGLFEAATAAEVRRATEISQRREEIVRKWEIAAARIIAVVRGIVGLRSKTSDLFFSPAEARRRKARQSDITENVIAYAKASGAKIIDNRGKAK